jgi:hypothetical protein
VEEKNIVEKLRNDRLVRNKINTFLVFVFSSSFLSFLFPRPSMSGAYIEWSFTHEWMVEAHGMSTTGKEGRRRRRRRGGGRGVP